MAIHSLDITPEDSMEQQLGDFLLEAGTPYADSSRIAVERFLPYLKNKRVVDLGCGDGAATEFFTGVKVIGVDINAEKLKLNKTATILADIKSYLTSQLDSSIPNIFTHHALEHLPNPQEVIDLIGEKLAKGGFAYLEVPANDHVHSVHHSVFDSPEDLIPQKTKALVMETGADEHYVIVKK